MSTVPTTALQLRSLVTEDGRLELSLAEVAVPAPSGDQVLVRIEAAPINPSDLGLLFAMADMSAAVTTGPADRPVVTAPISPAVMKALSGRVGQSLPVGNEGAGTVVAAGDAPEAQALLGRTVGLYGGATYSQYRVLRASQCMAMPQGVTPAQAASPFVNPLTTLGMVGTMWLEGHTALVHTAAASNLGQMLVKLCREEDVPLVNVVRRPEQEQLLRALGAEHVCNSGSPTFLGDLTTALVATGATLAFDAIGGGKLAGQILSCMEAAANATGGEYSRYGSTVHKQVYIYGGLDRSPTELNRNFGMAWGVGGWLLTPFLGRVGPEEFARLRERVAEGITTTFASTYTATVGLAGALDLAAIATYGAQSTGSKYLVTPHA